MKGGLVGLFLISTKNFPSGLTFTGQKADQKWRTSSRLFQWAMVVQRIELVNTQQPSQAVLAFLTKILFLWKLSSEMFLTKCSVQWYLLCILMRNCWKGKMRKIWPRMVKSHKKTDFRCFWQSAANWIFVLNKSRFSNFLKAEVCIHIFANKSSVSICISVFIS